MSQTIHLEDNRGITLIEILITAVLIGFLGLAFAAIFVTAHRYLLQDSTTILSQGDAAYAMDHMKRKIMVANRVVQFTNAKIAFRFDPNFPGTPTDFSDDQWAGYRLNGNLLEFMPNLGIAGTATPTEANLDAAAAEAPPVARSVLSPGGSVPAIFQLPGSTLLMVDLTVEKVTGGETRQTHLKTNISPRGVNS